MLKVSIPLKVLVDVIPKHVCFTNTHLLFISFVLQRIKIGTAGDRRLKLVEGQGHQSTLLEIATKGNAHRDFTILYKP